MGVSVDLLGHLFAAQSKLVPSTDIQRSRTAVFPATATLAFFMPIRFDSRTAHAFSVDHFLVHA